MVTEGRYDPPQRSGLDFLKRTSQRQIYNLSGIGHLSAHLVSWFSRKSLKLLPPECHILQLKCTKFDFGWGSAPDPARSAYSTHPNPPPAGFKGPTSTGGEGMGGKRRGQAGTGEEGGHGRGGEWRERGADPIEKCWLRPCLPLLVLSPDPHLPSQFKRSITLGCYQFTLVGRQAHVKDLLEVSAWQWSGWESNERSVRSLVQCPNYYATT